MKRNKTVRAGLLSGVVFSLFVSWTALMCVAADASQPVAAQAPDPNVKPADPNAQAVVVARIGDAAITREELAKRLVQEIRPQYEEFIAEPEPVTVGGVLRKMVAEKATGLEGRRLGLLQDEQLHASIAQFEQQRLVNRLLEESLGRPNISVEESEIDFVLKGNPKATREQARMYVQTAKARQLVEQFYGQIAAKRRLQKVGENMAKAAQIHQRLLTQPVQPRGPGEYWIKNSQVVNELSEDEKKLVLATYEGGQFTLLDWFHAICNVAPPRRPKDLDKPEGVERLLNTALRATVLAAEARSRGYDKDPKIRSEVTALEDQRLLYKVQEEKTRDIPQPTEEQVKAYFEENPQRFAKGAVVKADWIWCEDLETARKVRETLDEGADFKTVKQAHSLQKNVESYSASPGSEGPFWGDLWKGEPNEILGPLRGFYESGVKWRVVKVLEKTPAQVQPFSDQLASSAKWMMWGQQRQRVLRDYEKELLAKYPHEIYSDRIKDLDPLDAAMTPQGM